MFRRKCKIKSTFIDIPIISGALILSFLISSPTYPCWGKGKKEGIDWKLLFNQLFALEIKKELHLPTTTKQEKKIFNEVYDNLLRNNTCYTPLKFYQAESVILKNAKSSEDLYWARRKVFEDPKNRKKISKLNFKESIPEEIQKVPAINNYLKAIISNQERVIRPEENFFDSPEGKNMVSGLSNGGKGVIFILVPGFAAHSIKDYIFEELPISANRYYGRPDTRPIVKTIGLNVIPQDYRIFYGNKNKSTKSKDAKDVKDIDPTASSTSSTAISTSSSIQNVKGAKEVDNLVDVLHPVGIELGNTIGTNKENVKQLYEWISNLPEQYSDKKIILLGYSKGAPIVMDLVKSYPSLRKRIMGIVSYAGVVQGTGASRLMLGKLNKLSRLVNINDLDKKLAAYLEAEAPFLNGLTNLTLDGIEGLIMQLPTLQNILKEFDVNVSTFKEEAKQFIAALDLRQVLLGTLDLSPYERIKSNLLTLNDQYFDNPIFFFNLSALLDPTIILRPRGEDLSGKHLSPIAPALDENGNFDWKNFSIDAAFLYLSSIEGFKQAPAGLFDAQVELAHTKSPLLDERPLKDSLTENELKDLWNDPEMQEFYARNSISEEMLIHASRNKLTAESSRKNIDSIDLGEIIGHHWSCFVQALRPPEKISTEFATWHFPRMAYMRALMQVMGLYNLYQEFYKKIKNDNR